PPGAFEVQDALPVLPARHRPQREVDGGALGREPVELHHPLHQLVVHDHVRATHDRRHCTPRYTSMCPDLVALPAHGTSGHRHGSVKAFRGRSVEWWWRHGRRTEKEGENGPGLRDRAYSCCWEKERR